MLSADLLGRHVAGGSDRSSGDRQSRVVGRAIEAFVSWRVPQRIGCGILSFHNRRLLIFLGCGQFRQAEVEDLDRSMVRKKYVRGLDIAMDDALRVRSLEAITNLNGNFENRRQREWIRQTSQLRREQGAFQELHHDERIVLVFIYPLNLANVPVIERESSFCFTLETQQSLRFVAWY